MPALPRLALAALLALAPIGPGAGSGPARAETATVTGTATYRDRALLPPGAVLTVTLADISRADAPADVLATQTLADPGAPPYPFALPYDPAAIDARMTYAVSARVTLGDRLLMTSDSVHPVLTQGAGAQAEVLMRRVGAEGPAPTAATASATAPAPTLGTAVGLRLPATFTGTLPAASGPGVAWHLDMWPDQVFHLRRDYGAGRGAFDEIGRWHADPARELLVLDGGREGRLLLRPTGNGDLRVLTPEGREIDSALPDTLAAGPLAPTEVSLPMGGMFLYMADAALFTECRSGRRYPVAMEGAYIDAERAYLGRPDPEPGAPVFALLEGTIAVRPPMEGPDRPHLIVDRFDRLVPGETCASARAPADLTNTYWRIGALMGTRVAVAEGAREPFLLLRGGADAAFNATVGCNMMRGGFAAEGEALSFGPAASTMMACPPPLDAAERGLGAALQAAAGWRITGQSLEVLDVDGAVVLAARAVYLP